MSCDHARSSVHDREALKAEADNPVTRLLYLLTLSPANDQQQPTGNLPASWNHKIQILKEIPIQKHIKFVYIVLYVMCLAILALVC